jgi:hypothetical protein
MHFVISGQDSSLPKYHPTKAAFEYEEWDEDEDEGDEEHGRREGDDEVLAPLVLLG